VKSKCKGSKELLVFKDNGIGIDLQKNRDKILICTVPSMTMMMLEE